MEPPILAVVVVAVDIIIHLFMMAPVDQAGLEWSLLKSPTPKQPRSLAV
jgi:hypothetical protein